MIDLNKLAAELHEAAVEKGFWDVEDALDKHCAKMISELGEIVQADRMGIMYEIERDGAKPEGVVAEIADFAMMTMDLCVELKGSFPEDSIETWNANEDAAARVSELPAYSLVGALAASLTYLGEIADTSPMLHILYASYFWLHSKGYDLWEIIRQKMEYNRSRPKLHGRLY